MGSAGKLFGWGTEVPLEVLLADWSKLVAEGDVKDLTGIDLSVDHLVESEQVIVGDWRRLGNGSLEDLDGL